MLIGRAIFGIGTETMMLVQIVDISYWFIDKEYTLAIGITQFVANLIVNSSAMTTPQLKEKYGIGVAFEIGAVACVAAFFVALLYVWMKENTHSGTKV